MKQIITTIGVTTALAFAMAAFAPAVYQAPQAQAFEIVVDTDNSAQQDRRQSSTGRQTHRR